MKEQMRLTALLVLNRKHFFYLSQALVDPAVKEEGERCGMLILILLLFLKVHVCVLAHILGYIPPPFGRCK